MCSGNLFNLAIGSFNLNSESVWSVTFLYKAFGLLSYRRNFSCNIWRIAESLVAFGSEVGVPDGGVVWNAENKQPKTFCILWLPAESKAVIFNLIYSCNQIYILAKNSLFVSLNYIIVINSEIVIQERVGFPETVVVPWATTSSFSGLFKTIWKAESLVWVWSTIGWNIFWI